MVARGSVVGCKEYLFVSCKVDLCPNYFTNPPKFQFTAYIYEKRTTKYM